MSWGEKIQPLLPSPIIPLVAILVEWLLECCTEKNTKEPPVPRQWVDEPLWIWAVYQRMIMLDEWDENNDLAPLEPVEKVQRLYPSPIAPLVAVLLERLLEWWTEDEKELSVLRRRVDEKIRIWAPLPNRVGRKAGFKEASCLFLDIVLYPQGDVFLLL